MFTYRQRAIQALTIAIGILWLIGSAKGLADWVYDLPNNPLYWWLARLY
jgi:hypothetical protein